jgi:uncharacterized repeat protein (TIGR03803 family)
LCLALLLLEVPRAEAQFTNYWQLHSFGSTNLLGENPEGTLIQCQDGFIYGVTSHGGITAGGTVFRVVPDGTGYTTLYQFDNSLGSSDGYLPAAGLLAGSDGALYGTTYAGGTNGNGVVFRIRKDGTGYLILHHFGFFDAAGPPQGVIEGTDGALYGSTEQIVFKMDKNGGNFMTLFQTTNFISDPYALNGLIQGSDGQLYGTSWMGGTNDLGTIFKLRTDGAGFSVLWRFTGTNGDGSEPMTALVEAKDGVLFGTTRSGGTNHYGTIFRLNKDGGGYAVVHNFNSVPNDGSWPNVLKQGSDLMLYGTTEHGGTAGLGAVIRLNEDGTSYAVIKSLPSSPADGSYPRAGLLEGADGWLYCTAYSGGRYSRGTLFRLHKDGGGYATLRTFLFWPSDGTTPRTALMEGSDGALYGTTDPDGAAGISTVFRLRKDGTDYSMLATFSNTPNGPLWEGSDGALYGLTQDYLLFKLNKDGSGLTLRSLAIAPNSPLLEGSDGAFYGTGIASAPKGEVFKVNKDGTGITPLHTFAGAPSDGDGPEGPLLLGRDGVLYGTTAGGGAANAGTVFRLNQTGDNYSTLYSFSGGASAGHLPYGKLLEGSDGAFYGVAMYGGGTNQGMIYKVSKGGSGYAELKTFSGDGVEGGSPASELVEGRDGALYGVNTAGSISGQCTLFKLNEDGSGFLILRSFTDPTITPPLMATDGALYGTTVFGGDLDFGTIYRFGHVLSLSKSPNGTDLGIAGIPGYTYALQRSTDLAAWAELGRFLMPPSALVPYVDANAPPAAAFYRIILP